MGLTNQDPGCCCSGACTTTICLANQCTGGVSTNVLVTILSGGTTISSGTTGLLGCVTLSIPSAGTYTVTTAATTRYASTSSSRALTCGGTTTITLFAKTGYGCLPCFLEPIPDTLIFTVDGVPYSISGIVTGGGTVNFTDTRSNAGMLTFGPFYSCSGAMTTNPCVSGGSLTTKFIVTFQTGGANPCSVNQIYAFTSTCTHDVAHVPCVFPTDYPFYSNDLTSGGGTFFQWNSGALCLGYCNSNCNQAISIGTGNPVPVNLTLTYSLAGSVCPTALLGPPLTNVVITE
jgi:hypothetical protein